MGFISSFDGMLLKSFSNTVYANFSCGFFSRKKGAKLNQDAQGGPNTAHVVVKNIDIRIHQSLGQLAVWRRFFFFDGWKTC